MLEPDTVLNDRYRLIEQVGEGGMATVYRALDTRLGRTVAIKVLHPEYARDQPFLQRFQQEAEFAASLGSHPNVVAIYDIGQDAGLRYIVMELVEGRNLKDIIRERAPLTVAEAFAIGRQVASALDFAHKRGLVHRDVKPQNILVTPDGVAKVTDFGIARSVSASQLTRTGMVIGTAHYFSPEQAQGKSATPASDIYALGVILYEMLTGHLPFDADTAVGVAMQHIHSDPPSPWDYNPTLPARAVSTVLRALEKDPQRRYRDAAELASALSVAPAAVDLGGTTAVQPIVPEPTRVIRPAEPEPSPERFIRVAEPVAKAATVRPVNPWRSAWVATGGVIALLLAALAAYFVTSRVLAGSSSTPTPTVTATPKPTPRPHHHRPTPIPTVPVVVPTAPPTLPPPVPTNTSPPPATSTPPPKPTPTPKPRPTLPPTPAPTIEILGPTPTPTPLG